MYWIFVCLGLSSLPVSLNAAQRNEKNSVFDFNPRPLEIYIYLSGYYAQIIELVSLLL